MNWAEQRAQILATIKSKKGVIQGIQTKASTEKRTTTDDEETQVKAVEDDLARLQVNLTRIEGFIADVKVAAEKATPVAGADADEADATAEGEEDPEKAAKKVSVKSNLDGGIGFAKAMRARVAAQLERKNGNDVSAIDVAKSRNEPEQVIRFLQKDAIVGRTDAAEMLALVEDDNLSNEFIELLRKRTVFDQLVGFREVPFNTKMVNQLTGGVAAWVGEGLVKPTTNPTFGTVKIEEHKLAAISIFTDEFLRNSKPKADSVFLEDLLVACAELIDGTFLSAVAGDDTKPAGILNGVTAITPTGRTGDTYRADLRALAVQFLIGNKSLTGAQIIMSEVAAYELADLVDALGNTMFRGMDAQINSKAFKGINVVESEAADGKIIMIKPSEILLADDGRVDVSYSDQATIQNGATAINLWQQNMSAVRVERFISWAKRRSTAVSFLDYSLLI